MYTAPSLRPMFAFSGWVIDSIDIDWKASLAVVYLRRDGRIQRIKCNRCHHAIGKMRETERTVQELPLGKIAVLLRFIAYQGRCSKCGQIETFTLLGLSSKAHATDRLKQHVSHLCRYMPSNKVSEFIAIENIARP